MPFYINRALPSGPIRFGVGERNTEPASDPTDGSFSTGPAGEYLRLRPESHFYSDSAPAVGDEIGATAVGDGRRERTIPIWGWVSIGFGALLILLGILVVANKGYKSGYVEAVVGALLIALPFVVTAAKRAEMRRRIAKERAEREAEDARLREAAGGYTAAIERLRSARDESVLREIRASRQKDLPPEVITRMGKPAVQRAGFEAMTRWEEEGAERVANAIRRAAEATGITPEDEAEVRLAVVQRAWWHLLADDRLTDSQKTRLDALSRALGLDPAALEAEARATTQFEQLRGLDSRNLPRVDPPMRLRAMETCLHKTRGSVTSLRRERKIGTRVLVEGGWKDSSEQDVTVTNQRLLVRGGKDLEIDVRSIRDLEVDIDRGILAVIAREQKDKAHYLRLPDPIYVAGLLDAALGAPVKPKGLV